MTLMYCDVCGAKIDVDALPKPTHYSLTLSHYNPNTAWDAYGPHWTHLCLTCTTSVRAILAEFADTRSQLLAARRASA